MVVARMVMLASREALVRELVFFIEIFLNWEQNENRFSLSQGVIAIFVQKFFKNLWDGCVVGWVGGGVVLGFSFWSGAVALVHQLLWMRRMVDLLGAAAESQARVIGLFFLGLSLGGVLGGWLGRRVGRPWFVMGLVEFGIIGATLPMLVAGPMSGEIWGLLGAGRAGGWEGRIWEVVVCVVMVFPPAVLMGLFVPLAVAGAGMCVGWRSAGVWIYALNTLGAVAGVGVVLGYLWQEFGLGAGLLVAMGGNGLAGLVCLILDAGRRVSSVDGVVAGRGLPGGRWLGVAWVSGFLVLAAEVCAVEMMQLQMPMAFYGPGVVLGVVIGMLGLSGLIVAVSGRRIGVGGLGKILVLSGVLTFLTPVIFLGLGAIFPVAERDGTLGEFLGRLVVFGLVVVGPAFILGGFVFPLVAGQFAGPGAGVWGWLLAVNGVGGWMGAEVAYGWLLPVYGPYSALGLLGFGYGLVGLVLWGKGGGGGVWGLGAAWVIVAGCGVAAWLIYPGMPRVHPALQRFVIDQRHGRDGALAILEGEPFGRAMLVANQYFLGSSAAAREQGLQAKIPLGRHPAPERVGFIGVATGITPGAAIGFPGVREIEMVEISPQVLDAARRYFGEWNGGVVDHPGVRVEVVDGRIWLASRRGWFDVLCGDLFLPWGPGEGRLFSVEHFRNAREALREGGVFAQWLPMYQLTAGQFDVIAATFLEVFGEAEVYLRDGDEDMPVVGFFGWREGGAMQKGGRLWGEGGAEHKAEGGGGLGLRLGVLRRGQVTAKLNTLNNSILERDAALQRVTKPNSAGYLTGERWREWLFELRRLLGSEGDGVGES